MSAAPGDAAGRIAFGDDGLVPAVVQDADTGRVLTLAWMNAESLGRTLETGQTWFWSRSRQELWHKGATSGDTGSAAEYAMRGKKGVRVFMTSPHGRMSPFQQAQMFSLQDPNIHNIAIEGVFDDCQDLVKAVSGDHGFKRKYRIGTVNSINWARLLAQVVYYFAGYFQATQRAGQAVSFTVPSGNFGNVCAGHVARSMGLPIDQLVVATNENDVLDVFFKTGVYQVRSSEQTHETSSPSMDISKASNFERFVFDLVGRDAALTAELFGGGQGLGYLINVARQDYDTAILFAVILLIIGFVSLADRWVFLPLERYCTRQFGVAA